MSSIRVRPVALVPYVVCVISAITVLAICAAAGVPIGSKSNITQILLPGTVLFVVPIYARKRFGPTRFVAVGTNLAFFALISLFAIIASAAVAIGHNPYIDSLLEVADQIIDPWYDWPAVARGLTTYPMLQIILSYLYVTLNWQPFLLFGACAIGLVHINQIDRFVAAWGLALTSTIATFHWLPAQGAYVHYGIGVNELPGMRLDLPWRYPESLSQLRSAHPVIDRGSLIGIVTVPSFHACAAVLLAWGFARSRLLRWPMVLLNAGMATSAVTMGGHYLADIVVGIFVALCAIAVACALDGEPLRWPKRRPARSTSAALWTTIKKLV